VLADYADDIFQSRAERPAEAEMRGAFLGRHPHPLAEFRAEYPVPDLEILDLLDEMGIDDVGKHDEKGME